MRSRYEDGIIAFMGGGQPEPFPLPVMFKRVPGELQNNWPQKHSGSSFVTMFCAEDSKKPLRLKAIYYSRQFTQKNINDKTIDRTTLDEMDQILESIH